MQRLLVLLSLVAVLGPGAAWAGPSDDAAIAADAAVTEHCAGAWGEDSRKPAAILAVGEALQAVQDAYEAEQAPFLLYWRGALYKCLGQFDAALDDLEAFVKAERANPAYSQQVKVAGVQLERAGRALDAAGGGDSAEWIRRKDPLEFSLSLGAGLAYRFRDCTEPAGGRYASNCIEASGWSEGALGAVPIDGRFAVTGFFAAPIGLSASLTAQWAWPDESKSLEDVDTDPSEAVVIAQIEKNNSIDWGVTQPSLVAAIGPVIRVASWQSEGRASGVRIEPQFDVGFSWFEPMAGHYLWAETDRGYFQTFGGEWLAVNLGGGLRVAGHSELSNRALLLGHVRAIAFGPATGALLSQTRESGGNVLIPVQPERADRVLVDAGFTILVVPPGPGIVALGPDLQVGFDARWMTFPADLAFVWDLDGDGSVDSKLWSTARLKISAVLGITIEFGGGPEK